MLPAIALICKFLVTLLAIVCPCTGWVKQVFPTDEVHPSSNLQSILVVMPCWHYKYRWQPMLLLCDCVADANVLPTAIVCQG